jgi:hypothetical protein
MVTCIHAKRKPLVPGKVGIKHKQVTATVVQTNVDPMKATRQDYKKKR